MIKEKREFIACHKVRALARSLACCRRRSSALFSSTAILSSGKFERAGASKRAARQHLQSPLPLRKHLFMNCIGIKALSCVVMSAQLRRLACGRRIAVAE